MNEWKEKFFLLSARDQLMLVVGAAAIFLYILLFVVLGPLQSKLELQRKRVAAAVAEQQNVYSLAGKVKALQSGGGQVANQSLNAIINDSLRQFGLRMENFQPSGSAARLRLAAADFNQVLPWLHELEIKQGLQIKDLTLTADKNPGAVLVNIQVQQGE